MKRCTIVLVALILALAVAASPALAQHGRSSGAGKGPGGPPSATPAAERSHGPDTAGPSSHGTTAGKKTPAELISHNTKLQDRLKALGLADPAAACTGFKNLGQCVAAAHVAHNLGISFADLKAKMLGTSTGTASATSSKPLSLGEAIQALDPKADATAQARKAQRQANRDIRGTRS